MINMFGDLRRRWVANRVKPGDGRALKPFRWWQLFSRALFRLRLTTAHSRPVTYAVEVSHWENQWSWSDEARAFLYVDGRLGAESTLPAAFPVRGGHIEVDMSGFGVKRCHYVTAEGAEQQLMPDPHSAEGRRAYLERAHPTLSRGISAASVMLLLVGVALLIPQLIEAIFLIPPVARQLGTYSSPIQLPIWLNVALAIGTAAASTERALRMRYRWWLDAAGN